MPNLPRSCTAAAALRDHYQASGAGHQQTPPTRAGGTAAPMGLTDNRNRHDKPRPSAEPVEHAHPGTALTDPGLIQTSAHPEGDMYPMHPYLIEQLARDHERERLRPAQRHRQPVLPERRRNRRSARYRAGWALIKIGLRLTGTPAQSCTGHASP
jgi:hypothetical protein